MSAVVCNPVNLSYRWQDVRPLVKARRSVHREAADPTLIRFRGRYLLFASMSGGFWHSDDLASWDFHATPELPVYDYAPDVCVVDDQLVFTASVSFGECAFYRTADPFGGVYEKIVSPLSWFDPHTFQDDDGRVFFYWGCSNKTPIQGVELDRRTLAPIGEPVPLISSDVTAHGWEQVGDDHDPRQRSTFFKVVTRLTGGGPFIEGAWMTKHEGTYYLQYAAPGTEANTYADGYYTATSPLGPYTYSPDSPFSAKFGGFITAAGHGSTVQDDHGNWWHAATMRISRRHEFERRVGVFPAGFDADGVLFCNQEFADYPMVVPDGPFDPWADASPGWMLLSHGKAATASSSVGGHEPDLAVDEDIRTWWVAGRSTPGQWLTVDLGAVSTVQAVQVNTAEHEVQAPKPPQRKFVTLDRRYMQDAAVTTEYRLETSTDGETWTTVRDTRGLGQDLPHDFVVLDEAVQARFVRITGYLMPFASAFALAGLRVFGRGAGAAPAAVTPTVARTSPVAGHLRWAPSTGAQGYNVRYGRSADKLYHSWQVHGRAELALTGLNAGVDYVVAVDAFNENGITRGTPVPLP